MQIPVTTPAPTPTEDAFPQILCSRKSLVDLAIFSDDKARALSFYFDLSTFSDTSHREESVDLEQLVDHVRSSVPAEDGAGALQKDLDMILSMESDIRKAPRVFRAAFACGSQGVRQILSLPYASNIRMLKVGRNFEVVPLVRALEACTPYGVVLAEAGKARAFVGQGDDIHEVMHRFAPVDIGVHADDSRVGWSHHIDANVEERRKAFLRSLAAEVQQFAIDKAFQHLVIGCREDLWSQLEPEFARIGLVAGHAHLKSYDATPYEVLQMAKPAFLAMQQQAYAEFWKEVNEAPTRSAVGIERVLQSLEEGRVRKLFLGTVPEGETRECALCGKWQPTALSACYACKSTDLRTIPFGELMVRKALLSDAEILAPESGQQIEDHTVGALLRY